MKIFLFATALLLFSVPSQAHVLEELWNKYSAKVEIPVHLPVVMPGQIVGKELGRDESVFDFPWKYRNKTYEMHFENPEELAHGIYSLALFAHDVSPELPKEKFFGGVLGFHYSSSQIAGWLNDALANHKALSEEENAFAGTMLQNGIVRISSSGFEPGREINHVLGAAPGSKRTFERNLRHERLHVFWDEDKAMREASQKEWETLSEVEKANIRKELKNYAQDNEKQLMEEWAIARAEKSGMSIR